MNSQTLGQLYDTTRQRLALVTESSAQATAEADWLLQSLLGFDSKQFLMEPDRKIPEPEAEKVKNFLLQRIEKRIPIQYLLHEAWFFGLKFYVNPHVLIPRPETELLVEEALSVIQPGMQVLDVGTGPGTIAIAVSSKLGDKASITGVDTSEAALKVAQLNQKRHGTNVTFLPGGDLFAPVAKKRFDVIVSNPPYVDPALKETLSPEVLWHEPALALFSPGSDATHFYQRLAQEGQAHLNPGGVLLVEVGSGMGAAVQKILKTAGFQGVRIVDDYAGHNRIVTGRFNS